MVYSMLRRVDVVWKFCIIILLFVNIYQINKNINEIKADNNKNDKNDMKIFCMSLTNPKGEFSKLDAVSKTWAKECDKHMFVAKLESNASFLAEKFDFIQSKDLVLDEYHHLACKMYRAIRDVYLTHPNFDWYLKTDDDTYIFMDHLREFLSTKDPSKPITYGYKYKAYLKTGYQCGGSGYVLSGEAFRRLGAKLAENISFCANCQFEDLNVHRCLSTLGAFAGDSVDELGRERFHVFTIWEHLIGYYPTWFASYSANALQKGVQSSSETSISYHYVEPLQMIKLHDVWHRYLTKKKQQSRTISFTKILYEFIH